MAEWLQRIIGSLVVAAILGLTGFGVNTWITVNDLNNRITIIERWSEKTDGNRYKQEDGILERIARETTDKSHTEKIEAMNANQIRMWTEIRTLIREIQGHDYRLDNLDKHLEKQH